MVVWCGVMWCVCWIDIVALLVMCLLCGEKRHLTSMTVPKKNKHPQSRTNNPLGIDLHHGKIKNLIITEKFTKEDHGF